jgi:hypothetical protein
MTGDADLVADRESRRSSNALAFLASVIGQGERERSFPLARAAAAVRESTDPDWKKCLARQPRKTFHLLEAADH